MNRVTSMLAGTLLVGTLPAVAQIAAGAALAGVVRDTHGTPLLGAVVELLGSDASTIARAFTDDHGRYLFGVVLPGTYQVRASAPFLTPVLRGNVHLSSGTHAVADLTMAAIFETGTWLPTEHRTAATPTDDWRWTLRSTASRPLLRLAQDTSQAAGSSSSSVDHAKATLEGGQVAFVTGDGSFAEGGNRQVVMLGRAVAGGDSSILKADVGDTGTNSGESVVVGVGLARARAWGGGTHFFASFASHPELMTGSSDGVQVLHTAATESIALGDAVLVDAGTLFTAERILGTRMDSSPYLRVAFKPSTEMVVEYRLATNRALQRSEDLESASVADQLMTGADGQPVLQRQLHQEISIEHGDGKRILSIAVYRDSAATHPLQGGGDLSQQDLTGMPVLYDPVTDTLQIAAKEAAMSGVRMAWAETISSLVSTSVEAQVGSALSMESASGKLRDVPSQVRSHVASAVSGKVQVKARHTGSALEVNYRWQPLRTLTQVDEYDTNRDDAYLSLRLRQRLCAGRRLKGLSAVAEATNLLSQGYQPVLGPDGQTLFLAQVPRALQAGLAFSF